MNLRTLLILGRVSNLPTVWSNLLAGWLLARGEISTIRLALLLFGGSFLYIGGMYLNDYCDAAFDARHCPQRPIPSAKISRPSVGGMSLVWFAFGLVCLASLGWLVAGITLLLIASIVLYDFHHKNVFWAPLLMGFCRFLLYPLAASASASFSILHYVQAREEVCIAGTALGLYVAGITYLARGESRPGKLARLALLLLSVPIVASAGIYWGDRGLYWPSPLLTIPFLAPLVLLWMAWILIPFWRKTKPSIRRVVSGLLAGIVLVDALLMTSALAAMSAYWAAVWFLPLFLLALLLQRIIPAT